jgi:hypothetical protein
VVEYVHGVNRLVGFQELIYFLEELSDVLRICWTTWQLGEASGGTPGGALAIKIGKGTKSPLRLISSKKPIASLGRAGEGFLASSRIEVPSMSLKSTLNVGGEKELVSSCIPNKTTRASLPPVFIFGELTAPPPRTNK